MNNSVIKENIINNLDKLPLELQKKVQDFVNDLVSTLPKGMPGKSLLSYACVIDHDDADEMISIIEESCEKVDVNGWESTT